MSASKLRRLHPALLLAALSLAVLAADRVLAAGLGRVVLLSHNRIAQVYAGKAPGEVLLMGNSVADAMVTVPLIERRTGLSAYTMAVHGLDAQTQLIFTKAYLERNTAPRVAILEVRAASDRDVVAHEFTMFAGESPKLVDLAERQSSSPIPWRRIFHLYNFNSRNLPSILSRTVTRGDQDESGSDGRISEAKKRRFVERRLTVSVEPQALAAFVQTVKLLESKGTRVIVVAAPMHEVTRELGDWADRYAATVRAALPPNTRFIDALRLFPGDEAFEDPVHMNSKGRELFAPVLEKAIAAS